MGKNTKILLNTKKESDKRMTFQSTRLDEDKIKDKRRTLTISLSEADEVWVNELKKMFSTDKEGEAIKNGAILGLNVLHPYLREHFHLIPYIKRERKRRKSPYLKGLM